MAKRPCGCNGTRLTVSTNGQHTTVRAEPPPGMPRFKVIGTPRGTLDGFATYREAKIAKAEAGGGTVVPA
jgi:hypothetical protein